MRRYVAPGRALDVEHRVAAVAELLGDGHVGGSPMSATRLVARSNASWSTWMVT
jgi:hypothetical protein